MTNGPAVGDPITGQPASQQVSQSVAPKGYDPPAESADFIEVDGQRWTAEQIRSGALMQQDYTRKTQALSQDRARYEAANQIVQALQNDPISTLREMAYAANVDISELAGNPAAQGGQFGEANDGLDDLDPRVAQELNEFRQMQEDLRAGLEQQQNAQLEAWLDGQMAQVQEMAAQLGIEYNEDAIYEYAVDNNIDDPMQAFRAMAFDHLAQQPAPLPNVNGLKQRVAMQQPRSGMMQPPYDPGARPINSVRDALAAAMDEHNVSDILQVPLEY